MSRNSWLLFLASALASRSKFSARLDGSETVIGTRIRFIYFFCMTKSYRVDMERSTGATPCSQAREGWIMARVLRRATMTGGVIRRHQLLTQDPAVATESVLLYHDPAK